VNGRHWLTFSADLQQSMRPSFYTHGRAVIRPVSQHSNQFQFIRVLQPQNLCTTTCQLQVVGQSHLTFSFIPGSHSNSSIVIAAAWLTRITQVWALMGSLWFVVLSSLLTKSVTKELRSLVQGLGPTFPMVLVYIHMYLGLSDRVVIPQALWEVHYASAT